MSLVYDKFPGEWHGPGSISHVIKDLNKLYKPKLDFEIVHFMDGQVYYDKIAKAGCRKPRNYLVEAMKKEPKSEEQAISLQQKLMLFKKYILPNRLNNGDQAAQSFFTREEDNDWNSATQMEEVKVEEDSEDEADEAGRSESVDTDFFGAAARRIKESMA